MAAAPSIATFDAQCPQCGAPVRCTLAVQSARPAAAGGRAVHVDVTPVDVAERIREHIESGECGRFRARFVTNTAGAMFDRHIIPAGHDSAKPIVRLWDKAMNYIGMAPEGMSVDG